MASVAKIEIVLRSVGVSYTEINAAEVGIMIGDEIEVGLVVLDEYSDVSVDGSGGDVGESRLGLLIGESAEVETILNLGRSLLAEIIAGTERSSSSPVAFLALVLITEGPSIGCEVFNVIGINLAAIGGTQQPRIVQRRRRERIHEVMVGEPNYLYKIYGGAKKI